MQTDEFDSAFGDAATEESPDTGVAAPVAEAEDGAAPEAPETEDETTEVEGGEDDGADEGDDAGGEGGEEGAVEPSTDPAEEEGAEEPPAEPAGEEGAEEDEPAQQGSPAPLNEEALAAAYRRLAEEDRKAQQPQDPPPAEEVSPRDKTWTDYVGEEDLKLIKEYESEWSEVSKAEQIKRDAQLRHMQEVVYSELRGVLAPIVEQLRQSKVESHFTSIRARVTDFDEIRDPLVEWVGSQPEFVRPAFEQVLTNGTADQVVELVNAFKKATGTTGAVPDKPASSAATAKPTKPAPSKAAQRALAASPSPSRKQVASSIDPTNFDGAFEEAAAGGI